MVYKFKIQIKGIKKPPVWRRILVPDHFTFARFHTVIQEAFGWEDYHLYQFSPNGYGSHPLIAMPSEYEEFKKEDSQKMKLKDIFRAKGQKFTYIYDFGDDWIHTILLEEILSEKKLRAELLTGKGACPPEDCGGIPGYYFMVQSLNNPDDPQYDEYREWLGLEEGETWDVHKFDLEEAKNRVERV